jgi:hypothetical protein
VVMLVRTFVVGLLGAGVLGLTLMAHASPYIDTITGNSDGHGVCTAGQRGFTDQNSYFSDDRSGGQGAFEMTVLNVDPESSAVLLLGGGMLGFAGLRGRVGFFRVQQVLRTVAGVG